MKLPFDLFRLLFILFLILCTPQMISAQIATDGTLGPETALEGPNFNIDADLGRQDGANLFHSFRTFNIQSGESAAFNGPASVESIISRVTGGEQSLINGLLRSEIAGANLFFLNPAGVLFGPDATLEVDGSFHVTTADYLRLGEEGLFSAADPAGSRLASAPPSAFGFLGENPSGVTFLGSGSKLAEERLGYNGIKVPEGETLSVIAGDIGVHSYVFDNGAGLETRLKAPGGRINVASVKSSGEVVLKEMDIDVSAFSALGDIAITQGSWISVGAEAAGDVYIRGGQLVIDDQNRPQNLEFEGGIFVDSTGNGDSGIIDIGLEGDLSVLNGAYIKCGEYAAGGDGKVRIHADNLLLSNDSWIVSVTTGQGDGADIDIVAENAVTIQENAWIYSLTSQAEGRGGDIQVQSKDIRVNSEGWVVSSSSGSGAGGHLTLSASGRVDIRGGGKVSAITYGEGNGGDITITADEGVHVEGRSEGNLEGASSMISAQTGGSGDAGDIVISTPSLNLTNWGGISSGNYQPGAGDGGDITIDADELIIGALSSLSSSGNGSGNSGDIRIDAAKKVVIDGFNQNGQDLALIKASSDAGSEGAGNISIQTPALYILNSGGIDTSTFGGSGGAGNINIETESLVMQGGEISTGALADGDAGEIIIIAGGSVVLQDDLETDDASTRGSWISSSTHGDGTGGRIEVSTPSMVVEKKSAINSLTGGAGHGGDIIIESENVQLYGGISVESGAESSGDGGNIRIKLDTLHMERGGRINAQSQGEGNAGNIQINAENEVRLCGNRDLKGQFSHITALSKGENEGAGNGGDIVISAGALTVKDNAMIATNSFGSGHSGAINIHVSGDIILSDVGSAVSAGTKAAGDGGDIELSAANVYLRNGASITAPTMGVGRGGKISIEALDAVELTGDGFSDSSGTIGSYISAGTYGKMLGAGPGGGIFLTTGRLTVTDGGQISAMTSGPGDGGTIKIEATERVSVIGESSTGIFSMIGVNALGKSVDAGDGGDLTIHAGSVELLEGGLVTSSSEGPGSAGNISIYAEEAVSIHGISKVYGLPSSISAEAAGTSEDAGKGGSIHIETWLLSLSDHGAVIASTKATGRGGDIAVQADNIRLSDNAVIESQSTGTGAGGDIQLTAVNRIDLSDSAITTETTASDGGSMDIRAADLIYLKDSQITTSVQGGAGNGGNISIDPQLVILDHSEIIANAHGGAGGNIDIVADQLMADPYSTIEASSELGIDGQIHIDAPVADISGALAVLPGAFLDASALMSDPCDLRTAGDASSLVAAGFGGSHMAPDEFFPSMTGNMD